MNTSATEFKPAFNIGVDEFKIQSTPQNFFQGIVSSQAPSYTPGFMPA
jgi:hypothetical protein